MRSTEGQHFETLDHVRALAAFLVFSWHFLHGPNNFPVPFEGAPGLFLLAPFDEGQCGVSLFMTLSGYLFARLLAGREVNYLAFLWNRIVRLLPLLLAVMLVVLVQRHLAGRPLTPYLNRLVAGFYGPGWPNGGWSITVEMHFYLVLPFLLVLLRRSPAWLLAVLTAALALRCALYLKDGTVQWYAYWTILGRIDQFVLGILVCHYRSLFAGRWRLGLATTVAFCAFYWLFDRAGGFYYLDAYPTTNPIWIVMPTIEGLAFATMIVVYDTSFRPSGWLSVAVGKIGEYSYSIYLLHFFFVSHLQRFIAGYFPEPPNFYVAMVWCLLSFLAVIPFCAASYYLIERPCARWRVPYLGNRTTPAVERVAAG